MPPSTPATSRARYHHGNLRAALISATTEIIGEVGVNGFSVAAAARRAGVSSAAPFKHFADRDALLAAAALAATEEMISRYEQAVQSETDPVEQLAGVAAAYVRFAFEHGAAFDLIYSSGLRSSQHHELLASRRRLPELILPIVTEISDDIPQALELLEAHVALMHGYAAFLHDGFFDDSTKDINDLARRCAAAARRLVRTYI